jgi:cellulose biosynthesis protein BcsQ
MTGRLMIICIANFKGGSGKTTTAIHAAAFMQTLGPTILADGDIVRASSKWAARGDGAGLPFKVVPIGQLANHVRDYEHVSSTRKQTRPMGISRTPRKAATCSSSPAAGTGGYH